MCNGCKEQSFRGADADSDHFMVKIIIAQEITKENRLAKNLRIKHKVEAPRKEEYTT